MHGTQPATPNQFCPRCGKPTATRTTQIFVEYGEWDENRDSFDEEGDVDVYRCSDSLCDYAFANLAGFALEPPTDPDQTSLWPPAPDPIPTTTAP